MKALRAALAVAAVPFGIVGYRILVHDLHSSPQNAVASVAVAWTFVAAGLVAWARRPQNRVGVLMTFVGYALLERKLQYSHDSRLFTAAFVFGEIGLGAALAHVVLAYPSGRLTTRVERWFVGTAYTAAVAFPAAMLLVWDYPRSCVYDCGHAFRQHSSIPIAPNETVFHALDQVFKIGVYGVFAVVFIALIAWRLWHATPRGRRLLAPLLLAGVVAGSRAVWGSIHEISGAGTSDPFYWWQVTGQIAIPLALLAGLLSARLARGGVADLIVELGRTPSGGVRDALARALHDPTLQVAYWLPMRQSYVDEDGRAVELSEDGRAVMRLEDIAAIVHDPELDPDLVEAAGAAARLALHNARLQADVRAQLGKVQESRRRIVTAGDEQRRRIERDLHDGAQQRLVALALELRLAQRELGAVADPQIERILASAVDELQVAVEELRELARGVHPAVLTEEGLAGALESLAGRTPVPVEIVSAPDDRLPPEIEAAAYFVACEAITNAVKHSQATAIRVHANRRNGRFVIEVEDDGIGGAKENGGSGLRGLVDRVEAHGGTLRVESEPGQGTRVVGELPCAR
ncbi:MAG: sensor histidine kinase [Actinobacteria bacterium]|nr:MAG: sensor histidine kinase [Actinomycetota bacterium]